MRTSTSNPTSWSAAGWSARNAALKSRGVPDDDPRIVECREALAFHRVQRAVDAEAGQLSPTGVEALVARLREGTAR